MDDCFDARDLSGQILTSRQKKIRLIIIAVSYFLAQQVAFLSPDAETIVAAIWPPAGIALAALLLTPRVEWRSVLLTIFVSGVLANTLSTRGTLAGAGFMIANVLETYGCAWVLHQWAGPQIRFDRLRDITGLIFGAVVVNAGTALIGAATAMATGSPFWASWQTWWIADGLGLFVVTPLLVTWGSSGLPLFRRDRDRGGETLIFFAVWCVAVWFAFFYAHSADIIALEPYMITVLLAWPAIRLGQREVSLAIFIMALAAISRTATNPHALNLGTGIETDALKSAQLFVGFRSIMGMLLAASIAELRFAERLAREAHRRLQTVADNLPNGTVYQLKRDRDGNPRFLHMSAGVERAAGISVAEAMRNPMAVYSLVVEEDQARLAAEEAASERNLLPLNTVVRIRRTDGEIRWMQLNSSPRRLESDETVWDGFQLDVTDRVRGEEAIRASERRLRDVLENSIDAAYKRNLEADRYEYLSPVFAQLSGYPYEECLQFTIDEMTQKMHPDDFPVVRQALADLMSDPSSKSCPFEYRFMHADGKYRWFRDLHSIVRDADGNPTSWVGSIADITERKTIEQELQRQHQLLLNVIEGTNVGTWQWHVLTGETVFNDRWAEIVGYRLEELEPTTIETWYGLVHPEDRTRSYDALQRHFTGELAHYDCECRMRHKDGSWVWVHDRGKVTEWMPDGKPAIMTGTHSDITTRKRAESELVDLYNNAPCGYHSLDADGVIIRINDTELSWLGYTREEIAGKRSISEFMTDESRVIFLKLFPDFKASGGIRDVRIDFVRRDGSILNGLVSATAVTDGNGKFLMSRSTLYDVTRRERAEAAMRTSDARLASLLRSCPSGIGVSRLSDGRFTLVNDAFARLVDHAPEEIIGKTSLELNLWPDLSKREELYSGLRAAGRVAGFEHKLRLKNGDIVFFNINAEVMDVGGEPCIIGVLTDITDRVRAEAALAEEMAARRIMFDTSRDAIAVVTETGSIFEANDAVVELLGYTREELARLHLWDWDIANSREEILRGISEMIASGKTFESAVRTKDGTHRDVEISANGVVRDGRKMLYCAIRDITERKLLNEQQHAIELKLQDLQKVESLSVLAGGIAHNFNNILFVIMGNASMAADTLAPNSAAREFLAEIEIAGKRAADLCLQMLAYSGRSRFVLEHARVEEIILQNATALRALVNPGIAFAIEVDQAIYPIECDAAQIRQLLQNLVMNATEAIGENVGSITIRTTGLTGREAAATRMALQENLNGHTCVCIEVIDTGCGMSPEALDRIFEPFFTTKFTGRGLGMAAVLGIVRGHRGAIGIDSEPGRGTTVRVFLPTLAPAASALPSAPAADRAMPQTGRKVLVVDDEPSVVALTKAMFSRLGWTVETASSGDAALECYRHSPLDISLILLDLSMPGMDGVETFHCIREINPEACVIICSGYAEPDVAARFQEARPAAFFQKPFSSNVLRDALARFGLD